MSLVKASQYILEDPALLHVADRIVTLHKVEAAREAEETGVAEEDVPGIGLRYLVTPLDLWIYHRKNPWALPLITAGVVLGIFMLGRKTK